MRNPMNSVMMNLLHMYQKKKKKKEESPDTFYFENHAGSSNYLSKLHIALTEKAFVLGARQTSQQSLPT